MSTELHDCIVLPCICGPTYFRKSMVAVIAPKLAAQESTVQVLGEADQWHVLLPAPDVAALVFGCPNHLPSEPANGVVGTDAEAPARCAG